jgi:hypothetical protein
MARTSASDATKGAAAAAKTTAAAPGEQTPAQSTTGPATAPGVQGGTAVPDSVSVAGAGTGPLQPTDPANGIGSTVQAGQSSSDAATAASSTITLDTTAAAGDQLQADGVAEDSNEIMIYPLRSYLDGKEIRRAGGKGYKSPKHDAVSLVAAGLATDKKPKA